MAKMEMYHDSYNKVRFDSDSGLVYVEIDGVTKHSFPAAELETVTGAINAEGSMATTPHTAWILLTNAADIQLLLPANGSIELLGNAIKRIKDSLSS